MNTQRLHGFVGIALLALACNSSKPDGTITSATAVSAPAVQSAPPAAPPTPSVSITPPSAPLELPGVMLAQRHAYALELASSATVQGSPLTQFELRAQLNLTVLERTASGVLVQAALEHAAFRTQLAEKQKEFSAHDAEAARPFLFTWEAGGKITRFYFVDQPSGLVAGVRQTVLSALQGAPRADASWVDDEVDATGRYAVRYRRLDAPLTFERSKLSYVSLRGSKVPAPSNAQSFVPTVTESKGRVAFSPGAVIHELSSDEKLTVSSSQMLPIESTTHLSLSGHAISQLARSALPNLAQLRASATAYDESHPWQSKVDPAQHDEARVHGRGLDEVVSGLRALTKLAASTEPAENEKREQSRADLYGALEAFVRSRPGTVNRLVQLVDAHDELSSTFIDALASSGSSVGINATISLLKAGKLEPALERSAAIALSRTPQPSAESTAELVSLLGQPEQRTQAMYGIGTSIRHLREKGDHELAQKLLKLIVDRLSHASDAVTEVTALRAIANSGDEEAWPVVEPRLSASNEAVRAAAVESLQLFKHPRADGVLAHALESDDSENVRLAALRAIKLRTPNASLEHSVISAARSDRDANVRLAAVTVLSGWANNEQRLRSEVEFVAAHDSEATIRERAASLVAALPR